MRSTAAGGSWPCGLCGIESLEETIRPAPKVAGRNFYLAESEIGEAVEALSAWQPLHRLTSATHVAGFYRRGVGIVMAAEDVGRHNALDKLIGMMLMQDQEAGEGAVVLSSRVSVEMVQKSAVAGFPMIIAASSPTAHGARSARAAGITLATMARGKSFEVLSHPFRIKHATSQGNRCHVA
ncbi:MAG TPA: formate dehydrogenase accessory sulfurtransferase FdhD [Paracoccaceae bacterium]|nr:formate dehydrogenase accessory sulfurtransferase FdhD [Paracoccaceae bacterium]